MKHRLENIAGLDYGITKRPRKLNPMLDGLKMRSQSIGDTPDSLINHRVSDLYRSPFRAKGSLSHNPITNPIPAVASVSPYVISQAAYN